MAFTVAGIGLYFLVPASGAADVAVVRSGEVLWSLDKSTLQLEASVRNGTTVTVAEKLDNDVPVGLRIDCVQTARPGGLTITVSSDDPRQLQWPVISRPLDETEVVWPLGEGLIFPAENAFFQKEIFGREWDAVESMSLPAFGISSGDYILSWFSDAPVRDVITFDTADDRMRLKVNHDFNLKSPSQSVRYGFYLDEKSDGNLLAPAKHYREFLIQSAQFRTLGEKAKETTGVELLRGAVHGYLWGEDVFTVYDVPRNKWKAFSQKLIDEAETAWAAGWLKGSFSKDQWKAVEECAAAEWPYDYVKRQIAEGISSTLTGQQAISSLVQATSVPQELINLDGNHTPEAVAVRSRILTEAFSDYMLPSEQWGNGVSLKMLKAFADARLDRLKLCTQDPAALAMRPPVADEARKHGWLIGTYDSYHSVHSPDEKAENTWSTAQMTREIFTSGTVMRKDGTYYPGFRGVGRKTNSEVVRPFMERRVVRNFMDVGYNYYFMDCDATGEIYDDYSVDHPLSREMDAKERRERLRWITKRFDAVVGSEGGHAFAANSIAVAEGVFGPFFGWDEPEMKDAKSKYYRGRYYPPDGPDVFFKPVSLMERFRKLFYDPAHRIPLYATVFHDSVVATHHWNNGHYKYPEVKADVELTELLYLAPPLYHFNMAEFEKRKADISKYYAIWSPVHRKFGFDAMTAFQYLSDDRLVQRSRFGDCSITVNFDSNERIVDGIAIPVKSAYVVAPGVDFGKQGDAIIYTPAN